MNEMTPAIEITNCTKKYGSIIALDNVSLKIDHGEAFALLGPNGAGKTSLIRILLDFARADSGTTCIDNQSSHNPDSRKFLGYLPENLNVPPFLSAVQYLQRCTTLMGYSKDEANSRINQILDIVGLKDRASQKIGGFSKGMVQRLGIGAAIIGNPKIVILDEPVNGLDPVGIREIRLLLEKLKMDKITIFLNSHILSEVERICDSAAIIKNGKILIKDSISNLVKENESLEDVFMRVIGVAK